MLRVIARRKPCLQVMPLFCADDSARRFGFPGGQQLLVAVVRSDDIQKVGQTVVVIMAYIRPEEPLRHGPRRIVFVKNFNQAGKNFFRQLFPDGVPDFIPRAVQDDTLG